MNLVDRNRPIPLRELNRVADKARQSAHPSGAGIDCQMIGAHSDLLAQPGARPLLHEPASPAWPWTAVPCRSWTMRATSNTHGSKRSDTSTAAASPRGVMRPSTGREGSYQNGTGVYYGLAREANGQTRRRRMITLSFTPGGSTTRARPWGDRQREWRGACFLRQASGTGSDPLLPTRATWTVSEAQNTSGTINSSTGRPRPLSTEVNSDVSIFSSIPVRSAF